MTSMKPLLEVSNLHVAVERTPILHGVSLAVRSGAALGLVGESGSGKTMTARALTGMLRRVGGKVTAGRILIGDTDYTEAREREWRRVRGRQIAMVPQNSMSSLDPLVTVESQLDECVAHAGIERNRSAEVARLVRSVHLDPTPSLRRSYSHELSGGMRQRVMIAAALAMRPRILIADEPTTALDVSVRSGILDLLTELRTDSGLGLLLISHDLVAIEQATDEVVVMHRGVCVEAGRTREVIRTPRMPYTQALMQARPEANRPGEPIPLLAQTALVGASQEHADATHTDQEDDE